MDIIFKGDIFGDTVCIAEKSNSNFPKYKCKCGHKFYAKKPKNDCGKCGGYMASSYSSLPSVFSYRGTKYEIPEDVRRCIKRAGNMNEFFKWKDEIIANHNS